MSSCGASGVLGRNRDIGVSDNELLFDDEEESYVEPSPKLLLEGPDELGPNGFDCPNGEIGLFTLGLEENGFDGCFVFEVVSKGEEPVLANGEAGVLEPLFGLNGEFVILAPLFGPKGLEVCFACSTLLLPNGEEESDLSNGEVGILAPLLGKGELGTFEPLFALNGLEGCFAFSPLLVLKGDEPVLPKGVLGIFTPGGPNGLDCCLEFATGENGVPGTFGFCPIGELGDFEPLNGDDGVFGPNGETLLVFVLALPWIPGGLL